MFFSFFYFILFLFKYLSWLQSVQCTIQLRSGLPCNPASYINALYLNVLTNIDNKNDDGNDNDDESTLYK